MKNWILNIWMIVLICSFTSCEKIGLLNDEDTNCPCESTTGNIVLCENFELYAEGTINSQTDQWIKVDRANIDAKVLSEQSSDGIKALELNAGISTQNQSTARLTLGDYGCGMHRAAWKMYVPTGKNALFRINKYAFDSNETGATIYFNPSAQGTIITGGERITFDFYNDGWFTMEVIFDLDNDVQTLAINGQEISSWPYHYTSLSSQGTIRLSGIQFEANINGLFFLDEVCFEEGIGDNPYH